MAAARIQPERRARSESRDGMRPEDTGEEEEEEEEDIQNRLDRLLGRDSDNDSDQSYRPEGSEDTAANMVTSEMEAVSSDDSDIEAMRKKIRDKSFLQRKKQIRRTSPEAKIDYEKELKCIPSKMKDIADSENFDREGSWTEGRGVRYARTRHVLVEEIIQMIPQENPEDCCQILIELMSLPQEFWKETRGLKLVGHEELGLAMIDVIHRCISNKSLFLQTILAIGKVSLDWRESTISGLRCPRPPRTFLACCSVLISAGDLVGLTDLFQDYEPLKGETEECSVMRCVVSLMKAYGGDSQETLSLGGSSSVHTGAAAGLLPPDVVIDTLSYAVKKPGADVEWFLPLLCNYMMGRLSHSTL